MRNPPNHNVTVGSSANNAYPINTDQINLKKSKGKIKASSPFCNAEFIIVWAKVPVTAMNIKMMNWFKLIISKKGNASKNVAGIIPIPKYKEIVTALSVLVSFFIKIRHIDQRKEEKIINAAPNSIETSGRITMIVPINPIIKADVRLNFIFSFMKITARIVAKIGTVKPRVVNCAKGVVDIP